MYILAHLSEGSPKSTCFETSLSLLSLHSRDWVPVRKFQRKKIYYYLFYNKVDINTETECLSPCAGVKHSVRPYGLEPKRNHRGMRLGRGACSCLMRVDAGQDGTRLSFCLSCRF